MVSGTEYMSNIEKKILKKIKFVKVELIIKLPISWEKIKSPAKATVYNVPTRNGLLGCCLCLQHLVEQEFQHMGKVRQL